MGQRPLIRRSRVGPRSTWLAGRERLAHRARQVLEGIHFVAVDDAKRLRHPPEELSSFPVSQVGIRLHQTGATKPGSLRFIPALVALAYRVAPLSVEINDLVDDRDLEADRSKIFPRLCGFA